jgi:two-component system sensor histidine kinase UhpB
MLAISDITEKKLLEQEVIDREVQDQKKITRAVLKAQESERNKIGQELHDNVNQILASTKLYLGMAMTDRPNNTELIKHSIEFVEEAIAEIRSLSSKEVTPLKEIDLKELLQSLVEQLNYRSGLETDFKYDVPTELFIEDDLKLNIYRIVQEQINNMLKHAEARKASITINGNAGLLCLRVVDDGVGFDPAVNRKGIGISNMINRVKSYNGELIIDSSPGKGCRTEIKIPC